MQAWNRCQILLLFMAPKILYWFLIYRNVFWSTRYGPLTLRMFDNVASLQVTIFKDGQHLSQSFGRELKVLKFKLNCAYISELKSWINQIRQTDYHECRVIKECVKFFPRISTFVNHKNNLLHTHFLRFNSLFGKKNVFFYFYLIFCLLNNSGSPSKSR